MNTPSSPMDIHQVFHMKGGLGDTSYSMNSSFQKGVADEVNHITIESTEGMYEAIRPRSVGIADLGCSSGPNTLSIVKHLVRALENVSNNKIAEFRVHLNDLPTNDFNTVFRALPELYRELPAGVYISCSPGTFYGRLFPDNSLHFVYSSNSLHWLSRVPLGIYDEKGASMNKKSVYISKRSPHQVFQAYSKQFQDDFLVFLKSRSKEVVTGGRMVLILLGRKGASHADGETILWELLYQSLYSLATQGEFEEDKIDSYDVHFYMPSTEEFVDVIKKEGSFKLELVKMKEFYDKKLDYGKYLSYGNAVAKAVRSIQETMIAHHFGEAILDKLFEHYATLIDQHLANEAIKSLSLVIGLTKL